MEQIPPRWIRRLVITPVVFVVALILVLASPLIHLVAAIVDLVFDRRRMRLSRLVGIALAFCVAEVFGLFALFTVWVGSGFGLFMDRPFWVKANNLLAGQYMELVTRAINFFVGFEVSLTFETLPEGSQLLFARHVGPGDALRLMKIVFRDMNRHCHAVGAAKLQWDPFLDIAGERLGFHYLNQDPADTAVELDHIRRLTAGMGDGETLILCPEGGNFTPKRRERRINLERSRGREHRAVLAESLKYTLLPKTGGVMAAIEGAPQATVVFLGHAGLDDIHSFGALWSLMPLNRTVVAHGWVVSLADLPSDRAGRTQWLLDQWRRVDDWIDEVLTVQAAERSGNGRLADFSRPQHHLARLVGMNSTAVSRAVHEEQDRKRSLAAIVALGGLALLLAVAYWLAAWQTEPAPVEPPAAPVQTTTVPPAPEPEPSSVAVEREGDTVRVSGTVKTESERDALVAAVTDAGFEVDDQITVSPGVDDSDPRVVAALLAPLLDGTGDGELALNDGTVTITGEALDPVEAEEIQAAIATATAAGLTIEDQTTIRVLPESVQILELQKEIDQIFELAREIEGQYPNFGLSVGELSSGATNTLDRVAVAFRRYPLPAADIIGHTDSTGSEAINQPLSEARAETVRDYLVGVGVDSGRLMATGRGESEPVADNSTEIGRAENRRVDFFIKQRDA